MDAWMIRAGHGGVYAAEWYESGIVGIGWDFDGADIASMSREQLRDAYTAKHPGASPSKVGSSVGQVYRFSHDIEKGHAVVMYDPYSRIYHIGTIKSDCVVATDLEGANYARKVQWQKQAPRDKLPQPAKNSLGSIQTIFSVAKVITDLEDAAVPGTRAISAAQPAADSSDDAPSYASVDAGLEAIKDRIASLEWDDMELLVAGLLRAMGYCAELTARGSDGGRDVLASKDPLGLDTIRIIAEVKRRKDAANVNMVKSFIAGLKNNERGLYVSTGGFTKDAKVAARNAEKPVRLVDADAFVRLYIENYQNADEQTRSILPLSCIWCPA